MGKVCLIHGARRMRRDAVGEPRGGGGTAWSSSTNTARVTWDLNSHPVSALGCRIPASHGGFLGLPGAGSWVSKPGASRMGFVGPRVCAFFWQEGQSFLPNSLRCLDPKKVKSLERHSPGHLRLHLPWFSGPQRCGRRRVLCWVARAGGRGGVRAAWGRRGARVGGDGRKVGTAPLSAITLSGRLMERWRRAFCARHQSASPPRRNPHDDHLFP